LGDYHVVADALFFLLAYGTISGLLTRILLWLRPLRPGDYAMEESAFTMWKLLTVVYELGRGALLPFTTVFAQPAVAMLFGARIGRNVAMGGRIADPSFVTVGDGAVLGHNSVVTPHSITSGRILLRTVRIGRDATIGVNVVVMAGVDIGEGSVVAAGSVVPPATAIPPGELWGGVPARKLKVIEPPDLR
jgi:carbonic anhydrase/acetyltransferase-like protein (isoleucine patch superfamily)